MALQGKTILITRAATQRDDLRTGLETLGARVIDCPLTVIKPVEDWAEVDRAIANLDSYQWIVFTSTNAVELFMQRVTAKGAKVTASIAAIGSSTARQLAGWNLLAAKIPDTFRAEGLLEQFPSDLSGVRILLPRAEVARELMPEELRRRGAIVDVVPIYRTETIDAEELGLLVPLITESLDLIVFTSSAAIRAFADVLEFVAAKSVPIAVIGPVAAEALESVGMKAAIQPRKATIPDLIEAIMAYFAG